MELQVIKNEAIPVKAIPEETLNALILKKNGLSDWLCKILSVKATEENISRLETLLPMVKENCWSMSIEEIKKAFLMYVQGRLPLEPTDNYLTPILFSKVIRAYKDQKPSPTPVKEIPEMTQQEKDDLVFMGVCNAFEQYRQDKEVIAGYTWVFDHLQDKKIMTWTPEQKRQAMTRAEAKLKSEAGQEADPFKRGHILLDLENKSSGKIKSRAKRILLGEYFTGLIKDELHIKDIL